VNMQGEETANVAESSHDQDRRFFVGHVYSSMYDFQG
jgi:hypothetical protein